MSLTQRTHTSSPTTMQQHISSAHTMRRGCATCSRQRLGCAIGQPAVRVRRAPTTCRAAQQQQEQQQQQHQQEHSHQQQQRQQQQHQHPVSQQRLRQLLPRQAVAMAAAGAALGPLCDGLHSQHGVLRYAHPDLQLQLHLPPGSSGAVWSFETCAWVPPLFGLAGVIIGVGVPLMDHLLQQQQQQQLQQAATPNQQQQQADSRPPRGAASWPACMLSISTFVFCYWLSAVLEAPLLGLQLPPAGVPALDALLAAVALACWVGWDGTAPGAAMAALTALAGPAIEVVLINSGGLYTYAHPVWFGVVPTWLGWVYAAGGVAVGSLGRVVWRELATSQEQQPEEQA